MHVTNRESVQSLQNLNLKILQVCNLYTIYKTCIRIDALRICEFNANLSKNQFPPNIAHAKYTGSSFSVPLALMEVYEISLQSQCLTLLLHYLHLHLWTGYHPGLLPWHPSFFPPPLFLSFLSQIQFWSVSHHLMTHH